MAVTRNDVAKRAGVSPALVSYVLNDGPRPVSAEARARIEAAISELGYKRDAVARYLKTGKTESLGLVLPDIELPYFAEITSRLNAIAEDHGHQLLIATSNFSLERERRQLANLVSRRVDGIILMSVQPEQDFAQLAGFETNIVIVDRPQFAHDSAHRATSHLIEHGHVRLGYISGANHLKASGRRELGWRDALSEAGLPGTEHDVVGEEPTFDGGYRALERLVAQSVDLTAVVVESDAQACGVLRAAKDLGIDVPTQLAIVSLEGTKLVGYTVPSITSVMQPIDDIARDAISLAIAPSEHVRWLDNLNFQLVLRESCGPH